MISIAQNDFETADFLVSVGADVNAKTKKVQDAYGGPEAGWETIIYFDSHHFIYMDDNEVIQITPSDDAIATCIIIFFEKP